MTPWIFFFFPSFFFFFGFLLLGFLQLLCSSLLRGKTPVTKRCAVWGVDVKLWWYPLKYPSFPLKKKKRCLPEFAHPPHSCLFLSLFLFNQLFFLAYRRLRALLLQWQGTFLWNALSRGGAEQEYTLLQKTMAIALLLTFLYLCVLSLFTEAHDLLIVPLPSKLRVFIYHYTRDARVEPSVSRGL